MASDLGYTGYFFPYSKGLHVYSDLKSQQKVRGRERYIKKQLSKQLFLFFGVSFGRNGTRPSPAKAQSTHRAPKSLPAQKKARSLNNSTLRRSLRLQRGWRAQLFMGGGGILFDQLLGLFVRWFL
jgi:hypothetical protein